jgi:hypothetical protein
LRSVSARPAAQSSQADDSVPASCCIRAY